MNFKLHDRVYDTPVIVVCGAKNCGKSTFSRFLTNTLLNRFPQVAFLETDVGQTEFTPPGFVALNILSQPIIGPPFCHQRSPHLGHFFGDVTPKARPDFYLKCVTSCFSYWRHDPDMSNAPLVINTSGWVKGLGILLLVDLLRIVRPTHIIQLQLSGSTRNAPPINTEFLLSTPGWRQNTDNQSQWPISGSGYPVISILDSFVSSIGVDQSSSRRLLALLAYCSKLFDRDSLGAFTERQNSKRYLCGVAGPLSTCLPYKVAWKSVAVCILHEKVPLREIVYALNGSIVGLGICSRELRAEWFRLPNTKSLYSLKENSLPQCIGLG
jgi:polynucleotide 5'-hydroxyl-kinase GRC3/NOL9